MEAVIRGIRDRMAGVAWDGNPYLPRTEPWQMWRRGWLVSWNRGGADRVVSHRPVLMRTEGQVAAPAVS